MNKESRKQRICGAKVKGREEGNCLLSPMANGRCRFHGGKSTGPRTKEGLERMRQSKIKHGYYAKEKIAERRAFRQYLQKVKDDLTEAIAP